MDTAKLRELAALEPADFAYHADAIRRNAAEAADTIESLVSDKSLLMEMQQRSKDRIRHLTKERDAAFAEVERLQKERDDARSEAHTWKKEAFKQVGEAKQERDLR